MDFGDFLAKDGIIPSLSATSKKDLLQALAERAAGVTGLSSHEIFSTLLQRERLSSTGLGQGIAVPHIKLRPLEDIVGMFARLDAPIDFESPDGEPVDLIFLLLSPEHASGDHLKALARISRLVRDPGTLQSLRTASDLAALKKTLTAPETSHAA